MEIITIPCLEDNFAYLLICPETQQAAVVDPSEAAPVQKAIEQQGVELTTILNTHHHWDHVGGIPGITEQFGIPVYTPKTETVEGSTNPVGEGDVVVLAELNLNLKIMDVPGHTSGAIAYYTNDMVFSGDTLFTAGCGRMFEGTPPQMHASLSKFKTLSESTLLYCGHEYTVGNLKFAASVEPENKAIQERLKLAEHSRNLNQPTVPATLAEEKQTNPFLRCEEPDVISAASHFSAKKLNETADVFAAVRQWKDHF